MRRRFSIHEWESIVNTISVKEEEDRFLDVLNNDCTQSMKDTENECKQIAIIKQKHDRAYCTKSYKL